LAKEAIFAAHEHEVVWKSDRRYADFSFTNRDYKEDCDYNLAYSNKGYAYPRSETKLGCYSGYVNVRHIILQRLTFNSDFEQHGSSDAFETTQSWKRSSTDFAGVQDRLRDWKPDVMARIIRFSCLMINMLDFGKQCRGNSENEKSRLIWNRIVDGFRVDKATQVSVTGLTNWSDAMRSCAAEVGKDNFFISGEVTSNHALGAVYMGRGKTPSLYSKHVDSISLVWRDKYNFFLRANSSCLDSSAFHYTIHRKLVRFLGLDPVSAEKQAIQEDKRAFDPGLSLDHRPKSKSKRSDSSINFEPDHEFVNPDRVPDLDADFVLIWNHMLRSDDYGNANTHAFDPRNMYGASNQDVFRWPALELGLERQGSYNRTCCIGNDG